MGAAFLATFLAAFLGAAFLAAFLAIFLGAALFRFEPVDLDRHGGLPIVGISSLINIR